MAAAVGCEVDCCFHPVVGAAKAIDAHGQLQAIRLCQRHNDTPTHGRDRTITHDDGHYPYAPGLWLCRRCFVHERMVTVIEVWGVFISPLSCACSLLGTFRNFFPFCASSCLNRAIRFASAACIRGGFEGVRTASNASGNKFAECYPVRVRCDSTQRQQRDSESERERERKGEKMTWNDSFGVLSNPELLSSQAAEAAQLFTVSRCSSVAHVRWHSPDGPSRTRDQTRAQTRARVVAPRSRSAGHVSHCEGRGTGRSQPQSRRRR